MTVVHLSRKLTLETPVKVADGAGGFSVIWSTLGEIWADVAMRSGREKSGGTVAISTMGYKIVVRSSPFDSEMRPKPEQRFVEGTRIFRILAVADRDPEGRYLTCFAEEEVVA